MSYSFGKASPLDAEVAVRCFDFRWFANKKDKTEDGKPLCCIHVPSSWQKKGWIRWNWAEEFFDELPVGTVWPDVEKYEVYNGWERAVGKEHEYPGRGSQYMNLPTFSQDWLACGMVIEWMQERVLDFRVGANQIDFITSDGPQAGFVSREDKSLMEAICHAAIEVSKLENY